MAEDIRLNFTASPTTTWDTTDVADTAVSALIGAIDLGNPGPVGLGFTFKFLTGTGCVDFVFLQAIWSHDNSDFGDLNNVDTLASIKCVASTLIKAVGAIPVKSRYVDFQFLNESGGIIEADTGTIPTLVLTDISYDQA